jgi:hypothetical protein
VKSAEEIMNILEAYDPTGSFRDAGELASCSHHTVTRYVRARDEGHLVPWAAQPRPTVVDEYLPKLEELAERSQGKIRATRTHRSASPSSGQATGARDTSSGSPPSGQACTLAWPSGLRSTSSRSGTTPPPKDSKPRAIKMTACYAWEGAAKAR